MAEERDDLIVLIDENGEEVGFDLLDSFELDGNEYVVLLPPDESEENEETDDYDDVEEAEVVMFKIEHTDDGEDVFVTIEDEDELETVFEEFKIRMEDEYEFEDDEE